MKAIEITKDLFPVGKPVAVEAIIDGACGWEFDAPLHFMRPFHRYCIVGSLCKEAVEGKIEDLIVDLDIRGKLLADREAWPYDEKYLDGLFARARQGRARKGVLYFKCLLTIKKWGGFGLGNFVAYDLEFVAPAAKKEVA